MHILYFCENFHMYLYLSTVYMIKYLHIHASYVGFQGRYEQLFPLNERIKDFSLLLSKFCTLLISD